MHAGVRPVPLEIVIQSFDIANLEARMSAMARPAYTAVSNMLKEAATPADAKSAILFVPTRKQARQTALSLLTYAAADGEDGKFLQVFPAPPLLRCTWQCWDRVRHAMHCFCSPLLDMSEISDAHPDCVQLHLRGERIVHVHVSVIRVVSFMRMKAVLNNMHEVSDRIQFVCIHA